MYLGIDVGTSSIKVVMIDEDQNIIFEVSEELKISNDKPLYSEQNPEDWYIALMKIFLFLRENYKDKINQLISIGLTGQMHGAVCIDANGKVIRPAILWNDGRSYQECNNLTQNNSDFESISANKVMPGFTAPKILWMQNNEKNNFRKIHKVLLPKDYIRYRLTGEFATDMSDASGTSWLDVRNRKWSGSLLSSCGLSEKNMPNLFEGNECTGNLLKEIKLILEISHDVKVVAGASDNAAGALSMGVYKPGSAVISLGTSGVYFTPSERFRSNTDGGLHTFCHALPNTWHYMGVILSAASGLSWWKKISKIKSEGDLINIAKKYNDDHLPLFLPYLSGERTPHNDPFARASFVGMTHSTGISEFAQAVLEGVSFAIADCEDSIYSSGAEINHVSVIGGGAKSSYWGEIISTIISKDLMYHNESAVGPAFGAARLALLEDSGAELSNILKKPCITAKIFPREDLVNKLHSRLKLYRESYTQLSRIFKKIGV